MGRSPKFELTFTTRYQFNAGIDLLPDLGVYLPNLNSSSPLDGTFRGIDLPADLQVDLPNLNSSSPLDIRSMWEVDMLADLWVDLPNWNSSSPLDINSMGG